jgi:CRISPR-associated protein Cas5/CasD subtype I-E
MHHCLILCLEGPSQSWVTRAQPGYLESDLTPTKGGVLRLICEALGASTEDLDLVRELITLEMATRVERPGMLKSEFFTVEADEGSQEESMATFPPPPPSKLSRGVTRHLYLRDARFLVALSHPDEMLMARCFEALYSPKGHLSLGQEGMTPTSPILHCERLIIGEASAQIMTYDLPPYPSETALYPLLIELESDPEHQGAICRHDVFLEWSDFTDEEKARWVRYEMIDQTWGARRLKIEPHL